MPVLLGDKIKVGPETEWTTINIVWRQFFEKEADFLPTTFTNLSRGMTMKMRLLKSFLFRRTSFAAFKAELVNSEITISDKFLYGQAKGNAKRWLVYMDKENEIFQHRFVEGMAKKFGKAATGFAASQGIPEVDALGNLFANYVGHKCRDFKSDPLSAANR